MITGMISVVIPVYNAEKYIRETIESVLAQTYTNFEIIAVNDGSTDSSLHILKQFDDSRIHIIDKTNTGVSDTRNKAIAAANGEYICFLDADDYLSPCFMHRMYETAFGQRADMVVCNYLLFRTNPVFEGKKVDPFRITSTDELVQAGVLTAAWTKMIKTSVLTNYSILFPEDMTFGEDLFFCWKALLACKNIWFLNEQLYGYRISANSAIGRFHPNLYEKYKAAFTELKEFGESVGKNDEAAMDIFFTTRMPSFIKMTVREKCGLVQKVRRLRQILSDQIINQYLIGWFEVEKTISKSLTPLYRMCQKKQVVRVLIWGYKVEIERKLKNAIRKMQ